MTYLGAGGILLFFLGLLVDTSKPPLPLIDSSKLVSLLILFDVVVALSAVLLLTGFDRLLRKRLNADEDDADALIAASN